MKNKIFATILLICYLCFANASSAIVNFEQLDVQLESVPLSSKLKKDFSGYEYVITNNFKEPINIVSAQIKNGQDGNVAYQKSEAEGAIGVTWAIAGPVGLFTLGIGWAVGLIATPIVWVVQNNKNKKIRSESTAYTNIVPMGVLNSNETITVKTLVPIGSQPQIKLTIMDQRKNVHTISR